MSPFFESLSTGASTLSRTSGQFLSDFGRAFGLLWSSNPFLAVVLVLAALLLLLIAGTSFARR